jgi:hypothetical protein
MQNHPWLKPAPLDYGVRPVFRVLGAALLALMACFTFMQALALLQVGEIKPAQCSGSRQFFCVLGNYLLAVIPPRNQGPMAALGGFASAALIAVFAAVLLKPLLFKPRR